MTRSLIPGLRARQLGDQFLDYDIAYGIIQPMGKSDRQLLQMKNNPQDNWRIDALKAIARRHGIEWRQPGSSHVTFRRADGGKLTVPAQRPIKPIYIKQFIKFVEGE